MNRADTDTAHDAFLTLKASKEMIEANPGIALGQVKRKASGVASASKRKREDGTHDTPTELDLQSNSTPGGPGEKYPKDEHTSGTGPSGSGSQLRNGTQDPTNYDFFFPDLEAMANGRYPTPQAMTSPFNPFGQQSQFPFGATPGFGGWPPNGPGGIQDPQLQPPYPPQPYGMGMGMGMGMGYGQNGQNQANLTGFGLTMPGQMGVPGPGQGNLFNQPGPSSIPVNPNPNSSSNPDPISTDTNQPGPSRSGKDEGGAAAGESDSMADKSRRLREAVARLTEGDRRVLEGNPMTPQEMQERFKVQEKLISSLPDGDQNNRMLEAMQVCPQRLHDIKSDSANLSR